MVGDGGHVGSATLLLWFLSWFLCFLTDSESNL